jgi:hypothetical protein
MVVDKSTLVEIAGHGAADEKDLVALARKLDLSKLAKVR